MAGVVIVTGASAGIGKACADRLQGNGWKVFGASRRGTSSGGWVPIKMDVDDDAQVAQGVQSVIDETGRLDAVVAVPVGALRDRSRTRRSVRLKISSRRTSSEQHALSKLRFLRCVLSARGRIVLVSSLGGLIGLPFQAFYSASKFAMEGYGEALAYEVEPFGIHVTLVEPGNFKTEFTASRRDVPQIEGDDPYASASAKAITVMERDESNGAPPAQAAKLVEQVLDAKHPPLRVLQERWTSE